jgi:hypothetical protein
MGTGFLMGIDIFHGYGFEMAKPSGFVPIAISSRRRRSLPSRQPTDTLSRAVRLVANMGPVGSPRHASVVATTIIGSYARNEVDV